MQISNECAKVAAALAAAQKNFAPIPKDREVTVTTKTGGSYRFKYATLDAIRSATMPALAEQGLALVQGLSEDGTALETLLVHSSGEWMKNSTPMIVSGRVVDGRVIPPSNQEHGSAQSYARRYGISALLCVTADEDDDANIADGNSFEGQRVPYRPNPKNGNGTTSNYVADAERDGIVDNSRQKGEMPGTPKRQTAAEKAKTWTDNAIQTLNLSAHTVDSLSKFWSDNTDKIEWLETHAPQQHERFQIAYDNAAESARAKVPA